ncbi:unnamed protein product [Meganyctiphanes norvegica]|uniref:Transmembrane protein n=1 Tax=Meganyctiphanes norvegica TaxID=48144 RepID=A0AAV2QGV8_MEGNR
MFFLNDDWVRRGCWHKAFVYIARRKEVVKKVVTIVLTLTLVMLLDYWLLNLQSVTLVAICDFGRSGLSIGEGGISFGEGVDGDIGRGSVEVVMVTSEGKVIVMVV